MASKAGHIFDETEIEIIKKLVNYQSLEAEDIEEFAETHGFDPMEVGAIFAYLEYEL